MSYITGVFEDEMKFYDYKNMVIDKLTLNRPGKNTFICRYDEYKNPLWSIKIGTSFVSASISVKYKVDNDNLYVIGLFDANSTISLYDSNNNTLKTSFENTTADPMTFIVKYDSRGKYVWSRYISGFDYIQFEEDRLKYDTTPCLSIHNNNLYITRIASNTVSIYNSNTDLIPTTITFPISSIETVEEENIVTTVRSMALIINFDTNGNYIWSSLLCNGAEISDIHTHGNNVYVTGAFVQKIDFYDDYASSTNITNSSSSLVDDNFDSTIDNLNDYDNFVKTNIKGFVAKYTLGGVKEWCRIIGNGARCYNVCADNNNVYVTGTFVNNLILYNEPYNSQQTPTITLEPNPDPEISTICGFISQYSSSGVPMWSSMIKGINQLNTFSNFGIYISTSDTHLYMMSFIDNSLILYDANKTAKLTNTYTFTGEENRTLVLAKYDKLGTPLWIVYVDNVVFSPSSLYVDEYIRINVSYSGNLLTYKQDYTPIPNARMINHSMVRIMIPHAEGDVVPDPPPPTGSAGIALDANGNIITQTTVSEDGTTITGLPPSNICFLEGTHVLTDQGIIEIQNITNANTINNIRVDKITQTVQDGGYLIYIEKDTISKNIPSEPTIISKNHKIVYNKQLVSAENIPNVKKIKYNGEILYNVLLEKYSYMMVNNMMCETLDPNNLIARIYNDPNKNEIFRKLNNAKTFNEYKNIAITSL